jgi:hypothetical protein
MLYPADFEHLAALSALVSRWVQRHRTGAVTEHQLMTLVDSHSASPQHAANERPVCCDVLPHKGFDVHAT